MLTSPAADTLTTPSGQLASSRVVRSNIMAQCARPDVLLPTGRSMSRPLPKEDGKSCVYCAYYGFVKEYKRPGPLQHHVTSCPNRARYCSELPQAAHQGTTASTKVADNSRTRELSAAYPPSSAVDRRFGQAPPVRRARAHTHTALPTQISCLCEASARRTQPRRNGDRG